MELCDAADNDIWGLAYKVAIKKLKAVKPAPPMEADTMRAIIKTLFPPMQEVSMHPPPGNIQIPSGHEVTVEEVVIAANKLGNDKAPGPDRIPNKAVKLAIELNPGAFVDLYNLCLKECRFPDRWKVQKLVLLPKPNKQNGDPASFRPICLIDTAGKLLEKILATRLNWAIGEAGDLSPMQFGFRKQRSTLDAIATVVDIAAKALEGTRWKGGTKQYCVVLTLDIKNAFNTANWAKILSAIANFEVPEYLYCIIEDYFKDRVLKYQTLEGEESYSITGGVPQGSVLGPILWNAMYDGILRLQLPGDTSIIGFADDVAVVVVAKQVHEVEEKCGAAVSIIKDWLSRAGLQLADQKTEAVLMSSRKIPETIQLNMGSTIVQSARAIKYLGVYLDDRLSFKEHLMHASSRAAELGRSLSRIMLNTRGPKQARRRLLIEVIKSTMLYGAQVWAKATETKSYRRGLESTYRLGALRVCSGFRTVSDDAALVIAGLIPIDLLAVEAQELFALRQQTTNDQPSAREHKRQVRSRVIEDWQRRWDASSKGRWTHILIPDVRKWVQRRHGQVNFYLTQMLSGHGVFRNYLHRFGHDSSPECQLCSLVEDAEHILFHCPRFAESRARMSRKVGSPISRSTIVDKMLESAEKWEAVCSFAEDSMRTLRSLERQRNLGGVH
jgi:hypothetical protein